MCMWNWPDCWMAWILCLFFPRAWFPTKDIIPKKSFLLTHFFTSKPTGDNCGWVCLFQCHFSENKFSKHSLLFYSYFLFFAGMWEVPMTAIKDVRGGTCAMADGCYYEEDAASIQKIFTQNFLEHYTKSKAPFPLFFHSAWFFNRAHRQDGFFKFVDSILALPDVYFVTSQELIEWVRTPVPLDSIESSGMFHCNFSDRPARCSGRRKHKCQLKHKGDVRQWASCQRVCPNRYPWVNNLNGEWFVLNSDPG